MPGVRRSLGAVLASVVLLVGITVVGAAPAVSADDPAPPLPTAHRSCNVGVFGRIPSELPAGKGFPAWAEPKDYVLWRYDTGFSVVASCVADIGGSFPTHYTSGDELRLGMVVMAPAVAGMRRSVYALDGVPGRDENGRIWSSAAGQTLVHLCQPKIGTAPSSYDLRGGFRTYCLTQDGGAASSQRRARVMAPLMTSYTEVDGRVRYSFRVDFEPTGTLARCMPGSSADYGAGTANWRCPVKGPPPDPDTTMYVPRAMSMSVGVHFPDAVPAYSDVPTMHTATFTEAAMAADPLVTDNGQSAPVDFPNYSAPGWDTPGGTCEITGWVLKNVTDGRQWSDKSADRYSIILTDGHDHELTVLFRGRPSTIQVKLRRDGETLWSEQVMSPSPPRYEFPSFEGDGERGLLFVSCIGADGDIDPDGQTVITDEPENERTTLDECMAQVSTNWTEPASYYRWVVNSIGCLLSHLFIPYKPMDERFYELRSSSETARWVSDATTSVRAGLIGITSMTASNCDGPTINQPLAGMNNIKPLTVCESGSALRQGADAVNLLLSAALVVATFMRLLRITARAFNGYAEPEFEMVWDGNEARRVGG